MRNLLNRELLPTFITIAFVCCSLSILSYFSLSKIYRTLTTQQSKYILNSVSSEVATLNRFFKSEEPTLIKLEELLKSFRPSELIRVIRFEGKWRVLSSVGVLSKTDWSQLDKAPSNTLLELGKNGTPFTRGYKISFDEGYFFISAPSIKILDLSSSVILLILFIFLILWRHLRVLSKNFFFTELTNNLGSLVDSSVIVLSKDFKIIYMNERASLFLEDSYNIFTSDVYFLNLVHLRFKSLVESSLKTLEEFPKEISLQTKEGEIKDGIFSSQKFSTGEIILFFKGKEEEKREHSSLLQKQKMQTMGGLSASLVHDFNNLLGAVQGNLMFLKGFLKDEKAENYLENISSLIMTSKDTMNKLLSFSKCKKFVKKSVNFKTLLKESFEISKVLLGKNTPLDLVISEKFNQSNYYITADPTHIHMLLQNLLLNAKQALREGVNGEIKVTLSLLDVEDPLPLYSGTLDSGAYAVVKVTDNGKGIPEDKLNYLFMSYFTTKKSEGGSGIGLSLVNKIIEDHGCFIDVSSKEGEGTEFSIYFPIVDKVVSSPRVQTKLHGIKRAMIVDDEYLVARPFKLQLKTLFNIDSEVFLSASDALEVLRSDTGTFDIIISDMVMPSMGGMDFYKKVRGLGNNLPFLVITGYANTDETEWLLDNGATGILYKPFLDSDLEKIFERINE